MTTATLLITILKIVKTFQLHASMQSASPAKISHNYTKLSKCLDYQSIKITSQFSGSDVTGRH